MPEPRIAGSQPWHLLLPVMTTPTRVTHVREVLIIGATDISDARASHSNVVDLFDLDRYSEREEFELVLRPEHVCAHWAHALVSFLRILKASNDGIPRILSLTQISELFKNETVGSAVLSSSFLTRTIVTSRSWRSEPLRAMLTRL